MLLDSNEDFAPQIRDLDGGEFEKVVAASVFHLGYMVFRNVKFTINKQEIAEVDVFGSYKTPFMENRIAIECKTSGPSFNDLRKFASISRLEDHPNVNLIAFGDNSTRQEHQKLAKLLNVDLNKEDDLSKLILPYLNIESGESKTQFLKELNNYLTIYNLKDTLIQKRTDQYSKEVQKKIKGYYLYLYRDLWAITDPFEQMKDSFKKAKEEYENFTEDVTSKLDTDLQNELSEPKEDAVQVAMLLELEHRVINFYAIARTALKVRRTQGRDDLTSLDFPKLRNSIVRIGQLAPISTQIDTLVYRWVFLWGGILRKKSNEIQELAKEVGIPKKIH